MRIWAVFIGLLMLSVPASAGFYTGNDIFQACSNNRNLILGFVAGAFDKSEVASGAFFGFMLDSIDGVKTKEQEAKEATSFVSNGAIIKGYCEPKGINLAQVADIFCQFLIAKPALRHLSAVYLYDQALIQSWPCAKSK
jgi:hypothetical protein